MVSQVKTLLRSYQTSDERIGRESQTFFLFPSRIHSRNSFPTNRSIRLSWRSNDIYPSPFTRAPSLLSSIDRSILIDLDLIHSFNTMVFARSLVRPRPRKLCPVNSSIFSSIVGSSSACPSLILHDNEADDQHLSYLVTLCLSRHLRLSTIPKRSDKFHLV